MKKIKLLIRPIFSILLGSSLFFFSCSPDADSDLIKDSSDLSINICPADIIISSEGSFADTVIVTLNPKNNWNKSWSASIVTDDQLDWISLTNIISMKEGKAEKGLSINIEANPEYKRFATLTITIGDISKDFLITQLGDKPDAVIYFEKKNFNFLAETPEPDTIRYATNMPDFEYKAFDEQKNPVNWLTITPKEGEYQKLVLKADENVAENAPARNAFIAFHVGTPETSEAFDTIYVNQYKPDTYCYIWGSATPDYPSVTKAPKMKKTDVGIYSMNVYLKNGNLIIANFANEQKMPQYKLGDENKLVLSDQAGVASAIPTIDIDGMRTLVINFNEMTYQLDRITVNNCMSDNEVANYKTKKYIARSGIMKEWMIENMRWDGGNIIPKLGSKMVSSLSATGGYSDGILPSSYADANIINLAYEEAEIGGILQGTDEFGRIYCFSEILTGEPRWGNDNLVNKPMPDGWTVGNTIIDAIGNKIPLEYIKYQNSFSGNNDTDEANHPMLSMQVQGICPYGWHISNAQDWLDLAYAMFKAAGPTEKFPIDENHIKYKLFTDVKGKVPERGIENMGCWLRNNTYWFSETGAETAIADGADEFGFNYYPIGYRYMKEGYQKWGERCQLWVPLIESEKKVYRMQAINRANATPRAEMTYVDNGNAILPFRCVRNYK